MAIVILVSGMLREVINVELKRNCLAKTPVLPFDMVAILLPEIDSGTVDLLMYLLVFLIVCQKDLLGKRFRFDTTIEDSR